MYMVRNPLRDTEYLTYLSYHMGWYPRSCPKHPVRLSIEMLAITSYQDSLLWACTQRHRFRAIDGLHRETSSISHRLRSTCGNTRDVVFHVGDGFPSRYERSPSAETLSFELISDAMVSTDWLDPSEIYGVHGCARLSSYAGIRSHVAIKVALFRWDLLYPSVVRDYFVHWYRRICNEQRSVDPLKCIASFVVTSFSCMVVSKAMLRYEWHCSGEIHCIPQRQTIILYASIGRPVTIEEAWRHWGVLRPCL